MLGYIWRTTARKVQEKELSRLNLLHHPCWFFLPSSRWFSSQEVLRWLSNLSLPYVCSPGLIWSSFGVDGWTKQEWKYCRVNCARKQQFHVRKFLSCLPIFNMRPFFKSPSDLCGRNTSGLIHDCTLSLMLAIFKDSRGLTIVGSRHASAAHFLDSNKCNLVAFFCLLGKH